jgi:hypothetical protein
VFKKNIVETWYMGRKIPQNVWCSTPCSPPDLSKPLKKPKQFLFSFGFSVPVVSDGVSVTYHNIF